MLDRPVAAEEHHTGQRVCEAFLLAHLQGIRTIRVAVLDRELDDGARRAAVEHGRCKGRGGTRHKVVGQEVLRLCNVQAQ